MNPVTNPGRFVVTWKYPNLPRASCSTVLERAGHYRMLNREDVKRLVAQLGRFGGPSFEEPIKVWNVVA